MPEKRSKKLFAEFPPVSVGEWEDLIRVDLKGADYDRKLIWKTLEGIPIRPYYSSEDLKDLEHLKSLPGEFPFVRGKKTMSNDWLVRQDICVDDIVAANAKALDALRNGAGSIGFVLDDNFDYSQKDINHLLKDICLASAEINFISEWPAAGLPEMADRENISRGGTIYDLHGSVEYDPLGTLLTKGNYPHDRKRAFDLAVSMAQYASRMPGFTVINVNAAIFHNSGASAVQELAFAISSATEYLERLTAGGVPAGSAAEKIKFTFAAGSNYFMEIAKFRAARHLWSKVTEAWELDPATAGKMIIHAVTSGWNKTIYDPYVNVLRSTTETMSAVLGGADSMTVAPFDKPFRKGGTPFSGRIARNTQLVLKEEAYFDKVADPAAGSYYIESLTSSLIEESWKLFLQTSDMGGFHEAFMSGFIQDSIQETAQKRDSYIASRRDILLGTNQYPDSGERVIDNIDLSQVSPVQPVAADQPARPLKIYRGAQAFEGLRLKTEKLPGGPPKVFLLTYGNLAMRKARAGFSAGFFGCAGFRVIDSPGFSTPGEGVKAALESGAPIVVVCSSDEEYQQIVPDIAAGLENRAILVVAGYPSDHAEQLKNAGVKHFIHVRSNVLETLKLFQQELGIQ